MAGFSDEDIRRVREANDIVSVFSDRHQMRQKGRTFWCCCPFHDEATPSCQVDPATQLFYCFGCHEGGDVFSYIMKSEDLDFPDAVRKLAQRAHVQITESGGEKMKRGQKARLKDVCRETAEFYHMQLMRTKSSSVQAARSYLSGRGLGGDIPKKWQLGFAPGNRALLNHLQSKGFTVKEMTEANVVTSYEGKGAQDRFFNRIMFPIHDEAGDCIAFGGRVVGKGEPKYLNSQETPLFHKSSVLYGLDKAKASMASMGCAIVVEGYTDVIALHEAGVTNAVATLGTALTPLHVRALSRHARVKIGEEYRHKIIYLFDGDAAGQRAADRALSFIDASMTPEAGKQRLDLCACTLPDDLDPADFVAQRGVDALRVQLDAAPTLISYGIDRRLAAQDLESPEGRAAAAADAVQILAPIKDSLLARDYAVQIAGKLHMREDDLLRMLDQAKPASSPVVQQPVPDDSPAAPVKQKLSAQERSRRQFEARLLAICARYPSLGMAFSDSLAQTNWHSKLSARMADVLLDLLSSDADVRPADILGSLTRQVPQAARLIAASGPSGTEDDARKNAVYLAEVLQLGDTEEAIEAYRARLADPGSMDEQEYDLMFQTVAALQRDVAARREALHGRS